VIVLLLIGALAACVGCLVMIVAICRHHDAMVRDAACRARPVAPPPYPTGGDPL
jgi:hypothetical protein